MKIRITVLTLGIVLLIVGHTYAQTVTKSTIDDQTGVEVTVYNSNIALIKDLRNISLPKGAGELRFMDVAAYIQPETVHAESTNHPNRS